jgi:trk system potassium uptake protein TrkA
MCSPFAGAAALGMRGALRTSPYNQDWSVWVRIVILGCGRVGARLANVLDQDHDVTVIDQNPQALDRLSVDFSGETVIGNGIDVEVLREAGVDRAEAFVAVTNGDNRNLMAGQIARLLGVERVIVRIYDPVRCEIFTEGELITISPTIRGAQRLFDLVVEEPEGT